MTSVVYVHRHRRCANCYRWAERWHRNATGATRQQALPL